MTFQSLISLPHLVESASALTLAVWAIYKKEIQDLLKGSFNRLWVHLFHRHIARRVTETELKTILGSGLQGLKTLLLIQLSEYQADRVTVTEYEEKAGSRLATCVVEVRQAEMNSVQDSLQQTKVDPALWDELLRIHHLPTRACFVPDARLLDIAPMRDALLNSGVWSAYYQSLPNSAGQPRALLAISWHREHLLTDEQLRALRLSGIACATVLLLMEPWKPTAKP